MAHTLTSIGSYLVCLELAQHLHRWGLGALRCLEQSRHMFVLLGVPVSHTISTSETLLCTDAWTSIDSCLLLVGAPVSYTISTNEALVLSDAWISIGPCLVLLGAPSWHNIGTITALERQGASDSLGSCL